MKGYTLVCKNGIYTLHMTGFPHVGVFGSGVDNKDRAEALRAAKKYCRMVGARLTVEC